MKKEQFEWIHSWQDENFNVDLPRILLIGDSITHNYQGVVREKLKGVAYVDYVATSYGIDTPIYKQLVLNFAKYNSYDLIQFNFGLHAKHLSKRSYKSKVKEIVNKLQALGKVVLANSTIVYEEGNKVLDKSWKKKVDERNQAMQELSCELGININDLFTVSVNIPKEYRYVDGIHYVSKGYETLASKVASFLITEMK